MGYPGFFARTTFQEGASSPPQPMASSKTYDLIRVDPPETLLSLPPPFEDLACETRISGRMAYDSVSAMRHDPELRRDFSRITSSLGAVVKYLSRVQADPIPTCDCSEYWYLSAYLPLERSLKELTASIEAFAPRDVQLLDLFHREISKLTNSDEVQEMVNRRAEGDGVESRKQAKIVFAFGFLGALLGGSLSDLAVANWVGGVAGFAAGVFGSIGFSAIIGGNSEFRSALTWYRSAGRHSLHGLLDDGRLLDGLKGTYAAMLSIQKLAAEG